MSMQFKETVVHILFTPSGRERAYGGGSINVEFVRFCYVIFYSTLSYLVGGRKLILKTEIIVLIS